MKISIKIFIIQDNNIFTIINKIYLDKTLTTLCFPLPLSVYYALGLSFSNSSLSFNYTGFSPQYFRAFPRSHTCYAGRWIPWPDLQLQWHFQPGCRIQWDVSHILNLFDSMTVEAARWVSRPIIDSQNRAPYADAFTFFLAPNVTSLSPIKVGMAATSAWWAVRRIWTRLLARWWQWSLTLTRMLETWNTTMYVSMSTSSSPFTEQANTV